MNSLSKKDREYLKSTPNDPMGMMARQIRNNYGLWWDHPLTANWRTNQANRIMDDGVDISPDHPDQVSADILAIARTLT